MGKQACERILVLALQGGGNVKMSHLFILILEQKSLFHM